MKKRLIMMTASIMVVLMVVAQVQISIDANQRGPKISPMHYGIFFEDINHAADGGIYAELIRNRSFEDGPEYGKPADMQGWTVKGGATASLIQPTKKIKLLNAAQGNALRLNLNATSQTPACIINEGFWGINTVQGRTYRLSFFARGTYSGAVKAMLCAKDGSAIYAETVVSGFPIAKKNKEWTKYTATLTANGNDPQAQFALVLDGKGVLDLDVVSLFPPTFKNRENGLRPDLAQMLYEMHPKFMRFPGGCFVEGQISPENAFRWERTIGPIEERPGHWNVNWGYRTTDGIGFHEYLQMAEDLGAKPLYVVNVGLWHGGMTPYNEIQPWIDETLAALEYANGDVTTKYGALRAKNGHPAPFNIEYLEIGNENNQPDPRAQSDHYYERYDQFRKAILAKYPKMQLIGNVVAWGDDNPKWGSQLPVDLLDEHYYRNPAWFADAFHKYDSYDRRGPKIYVGEYAVTSGFGNLGNMNAALGEAVYMMGMENNSDIVPLNSYAPIFVNENDAKWRPDMIRFNSNKVMGTPSYYVQQLMPKYLGTQVVKVEQSETGNGVNTKKHAVMVTPKESRVGFATWATQASFTHPEPLPKSGQPEYITGQWQKNNDGSVSQTSMKEQCVAVCRATVGDHYTAKFRARKDGGNEGFIIVFNYVDKNNYDWINFGGWNNTQHGIEHISGGGKAQIATKPGKIETGRWYDVTLQMAGDSLKCWLDKELIFDTVLTGDIKAGVFSSATIDERTGELIVKVVNTGNEGTVARIDVSNYSLGSAQLVRLCANDGLDENTLQQPTLISPTMHELSPEGNRVEVEIAAFSLNIIRLKSSIHYAMKNAVGTTNHPLVHDPVMACEDGVYHLFFTGDGINQLTSKDRKTWTISPTPVMSVMPQWTHDSVPGFKHTVWAPDIIQWHNRWWLAYSCSTFGKNGSTIGLLSSPSLNRPIWYDHGSIVTSREGRDNWNAIDPNFVIDDNDQPWLVWGSFWDGIQLARLDQTMHIAAGERPRTIARRYDPAFKNPKPNPTSKYAGTNAIEAPFIMKHDGWYYLFVSWDYCCQGSKSDYKVAVGRSKNVSGPYLDRDSRDMSLGGGTIVFQGDKKEYEAAGHCAAYHFDGEDVFICHGYSATQDGAAFLVQRSISWTPDGWPELK